MQFETITSRDNSLLRLARAVRDGKSDNLIFVEGLRLCQEALRSDLALDAVVVSDELARKEKAATLLTALSQSAKRMATVSERLLESISFTKTPQGVVLLASRPESSEDHFAGRQTTTPLIVLLHRLNNPVNVGAILRTSEAAGVTGVIATKETSDPFSPKSLRGAMGSAFRVPVWFGPSYDEAIDWCRAHGVQTICSDVQGKLAFQEVDWSLPTALIMGPESSGLSADELARANLTVRIPMHGSAESLNVAVATGILIYEAARQRSLFN
jgi:TrmH family RNA methyltransferase